VLYNFKNFFNKTELDILVSFLASCNSWHFEGNGHQKHLDKSDRQSFNLLFNELFFKSKNYDEMISKVNNFFQEKLNISTDMDSSPMMYSDGQGIGAHTDTGFPYLGPDQFITFIFYLNDNYKDGNLFYVDNNKEIDLDTRAGDLVALKPEVLHGSRDVVGAEKYIVVCFVEI
jgi:hypothetical protein